MIGLQTTLLRFSAALLLASGLVAHHAHSAPPRSAIAEDSVALKLAQMTFPIESLPAFRPNFAAQFADGFRNNPQYMRMEKLFPGFTKRYAQEALGEVQRIATRRLPLLHAKLSGILAAELSPDELQQAHAFYDSPAGRALRDSTIQSVDVKRLAGSVSSGNSLTATELEQHMAITGMTAALQLSEDHKSQLEAFFASPVGAKLARIETTKVPTAILEWQTSTPKEDLRRLDEIALNVAKAMSKK